MFKTSRHRGIIAIMAALSMMVVLAMVAMAIDIGYILMTKTELHAACDASALGGGTELIDGLGIYKTKTPSEVEAAAKATAVAFAAQNHAGNLASVFADGDRDVRLGRGYFDSTAGAWTKNWGQTPYNMVGVTLRRDQAGSTNGDTPLPLVFAPIIGTQTQNLTVVAVAVQMPATGFYVPPGSDETADLMPFAYRDTMWYRRRDAQQWYDSIGHNPAMINSNIDYLATRDPNDPSDDVQYNSSNPLFYRRDSKGNLVQDIFDNYGYIENSDGSYTITNGPDGLLEVDLYPEHPGNAGNTAGNSGTIDLGNTNNASPDIARQIRYGLNDADFVAMDQQGLLTEGGELVLSEEHILDVEGETGISGGPISSAMTDILGQPRAIALFGQVQGPGNNAVYTLIEFVGVRVMSVEMNKNPKHIWVQPAKLVDGTAVPNLNTPPGDNDSVFTPLILIE